MDMEISPKDCSCSNCPNRWSNFNNLTPEELDIVCKNRYEAKYKPGETIFKTGSPTSSAIFLVSGLGKVYLEGIDGKNLIIGLAQPAMMIAGPGTFIDTRHHFTFTALTDVVACFIDLSILKGFIHTNTKFAEGWLIDISKKALESHYRLLNLTQKKMPGRLAEALVYFSDKLYKNSEFDLPLSRQELGDFTNMAKESVIRILKEFEDDHIIEMQNQRIRIMDKDKLKLICNNG